MTENEISELVLDVAFKLHRSLGPGLLESVYQKIMAYELRKLGLRIEKEVPIPVVWDDVKLNIGFRADLIVNRKVIIELKSLERIAPVHSKTLLTYLRVADCKLGLLINFGEELMKTGVSRVVNGL